MSADAPPLSPPRVLTIAGSDSGGGAGIQADLKTFAAHSVYGMSAITAVTAQNTREVTAVEEISPSGVAAQIDAVFDDIGVDAVKIGMLASAGIVSAVANRLRHWRPKFMVLDPVMISKSGAPLLADDAIHALHEELLPLATLVTPNLPEAERLTGVSLESGERSESMIEAAQYLLDRGPAALIKGGHGRGDEVLDLLLDDAGVRRFAHPRLDVTSTHGTGCTLSSAIAARLASGDALRPAIHGAIDYLQGAIATAYPLGSGQGPVHHFYRIWAR